MKFRPFGRTERLVSEIGIGTWGMGGMWGPLDDEEAIRALQRALDLGVTFIDTARAYGDGHAEELIGRVLRRRHEQVQVVVATKVPPRNDEWPARHDIPAAEVFPPQWIVSCTEQSLRSLGRETVELQQLHVWSPRWLAERDVWLPAVEQLKRQGKIQAFGISINDLEPDTALDLVASGLIDSVQVIYNIFEQSPAQQLFPLCQAHRVAVIVRVPFDEGGLTGRLTTSTRFSPDDWRRTYFRGERLKQTVERAERLRFLIRGEIRTLAQAALKFCLSHPAVSVVIPGMRRVTHVEENCTISDGFLLVPRELEELSRHAWPRNFYQ